MVIFFDIIIPLGGMIMSEIAKITITSLDDLSRLSEWYQKGEIKLNLSKISRELNCDRKTVKKRLEGVIPKTT